jgi:hypothetical protein
LINDVSFDFSTDDTAKEAIGHGILLG